MAKFKKVNRKNKIKDNRTRNIIIAISIVLLFVFSIFAIGMDSQSQNSSVLKGTIRFESKTAYDNQGNAQYLYWSISRANKESLEGQEFYFLPSDGYESIFVPSLSSIMTLINESNFVLLSLDPSKINESPENIQIIQAQELARRDLLDTLRIVGKTPISSVETPYNDLLVFGCQNASKENIVISYTSNQDETGILQDSYNPYCIKLSSPLSNTLRYNDLLRFAIIEGFENE